MLSKLKALFFLGSVVLGVLILPLSLRPSVADSVPATTPITLFEDNFNYPDGLLTNEYAYRNPSDPQSVHSDRWTMTSGSLFVQDQAAWTGLLDSCSPDPASSNCTNSNVFRLRSQETFGGNISLSLRLRQNGEIDVSQAWHGTHILLRYLSPYDLYALSINRADETIVIKRKVPCGPSNEGTYFNLSSYVAHAWEPDIWYDYMVSVRTEPSGEVWLGIYDNSQVPPVLLVSGVDSGGTNPNWSSGCQTEGAYPTSSYPPITDAGRVGVRGDFANFSFDNFRVFSEAAAFTYLPLVGG